VKGFWRRMRWSWMSFRLGDGVEVGRKGNIVSENSLDSEKERLFTVGFIISHWEPDIVSRGPDEAQIDDFSELIIVEESCHADRLEDKPNNEGIKGKNEDIKGKI